MTRLLALVIALLLAMPAAAHQQKIAISTVTHNPRTDMIEVVHRVPLHDAEHALEARGKRAPDIINDIDSRRAFARYLAARFELLRADGQPLDLVLIGSEIEGGHLLVYQEGPSPGPGTRLTVQSQILTDIWARQENRVNFQSGTDATTLLFREGDGPGSAVLR